MTIITQCIRNIKVTHQLTVIRCLLVNVDLPLTQVHFHATLSVTITPNVARSANIASRLVCFNWLCPACHISPC